MSRKKACIISCPCFNAKSMCEFLIYLVHNASFWINRMSFQFSSRIINRKIHAAFSKSCRHSSSNPKPNKSFVDHSSTINSGTFRTTIIFSSTFRTITCATLKIIEKCRRYVQKERVRSFSVGSLRELILSKLCTKINAVGWCHVANSFVHSLGEMHWMNLLLHYAFHQPQS